MQEDEEKKLLDEAAAAVLSRRLLPQAFLITPNLHEASALSGLDVGDVASMENAACAIAASGAKNVLIKGGHLEGRPIDVLLADGHVHRFAGDRIPTRHTHGTGCVYSASITSRLARGEDLVTAVKSARHLSAVSWIRLLPNRYSPYYSLLQSN